jgi:chemotaxis protein MotB
MADNVDDEDIPEDAPDPPPRLGVPDWMVTYGDMMTLLLCFFVLLFIFSKNDEEKYRSFVGSIQNAFGVQQRRPESPFHAYSPSPNEAAEKIISEAESDLYSTLLEVVNDVLQKEPDLRQSMRVETEESGVKLTVRNDKLFFPGTAYMQSGSPNLLRPVVEASAKHNFNILIKNNSPKMDFDARYFPSLWELSGARSGAILHALLVQGDIPTTRLRAMGLGDSAPLFPENDPAFAAGNNRTEFVFYFPGKEVW